MDKEVTIRVIYDLIDEDNTMRLRCIQGREIPDWKTKGLSMADHIREMNAAGWNITHKSGQEYVYTRSGKLPDASSLG
jgi:hypothetical protein